MSICAPALTHFLYVGVCKDIHLGPDSGRLSERAGAWHGYCFTSNQLRDASFSEATLVRLTSLSKLYPRVIPRARQCVWVSALPGFFFAPI
jgi:hypothetical protein